MALFQAPLPADEITWLVTEWPLFQYREGGEYKGYAIELQRLVEAQMPGYTHRTITANFARIAERIKNGNNVCVFGMYKNPEREQYGYFTIPDLLFCGILGAEDNVVSVLIEEGRSLLYSHTLCPKTPWGMKTVNAINQATHRSVSEDL